MSGGKARTKVCLRMRADSRGGKEKDSPEESGGKLELGSETGSGLQESAAPHNTPVARRRSLASRTVAPASALLRYRESTAEKRASVRVVSALLDRTTPNPVTVFYLEMCILSDTQRLKAVK